MVNHPNRSLTKKMRFALCIAAQRPRKTLCPVLTARGRINAAAETAMLDALYRRGLIEYNGPIPVVSNAGMAVVGDVGIQERARKLGP
jgi:hypothetical protein